MWSSTKFSISQRPCNLIKCLGSIEYAELLGDALLVGDGLAGEGEAVAIHEQRLAPAEGSPYVALVHTL